MAVAIIGYHVCHFFEIVSADLNPKYFHGHRKDADCADSFVMHEVGFPNSIHRALCILLVKLQVGIGAVDMLWAKLVPVELQGES